VADAPVNSTLKLMSPLFESKGVLEAEGT